MRRDVGTVIGYEMGDERMKGICLGKKGWGNTKLGRMQYQDWEVAHLAACRYFEKTCEV